MSNENRLSIPKLLFYLICLIWLLLQIVAPLTLKSGSLNLGEEGRVGTREYEGVYENFNPVAKFMYSSGDFLCHQKASRSFFINGNQLPYCARCTGIFLGVLLGSCIGILLTVELKWYWVVLGLLPISIDGTGQLFNLWQSFNLIRLITGIAIGIVAGLAVCMLIQELSGKRKNDSFG
ncbi:MAG: DUF2085 domain-containing protein [Candidatus Thermoplasmatota archaeon]|nr:DUF2085 domain-containing protein [Candidatus Thermoplasmatota archaeon]